MEIPSEEQGSPSYMAPELLLPAKYGLEKRVPSKEADIYALGMTIYQVLTGVRPFLPRRRARIIHAVILGERPAKPEDAEKIGMTVDVWDLLRECWQEDLAVRPDITEVLELLRGITGERKIPTSLRIHASNNSSLASLNSSLTADSCERCPLPSLFRSFLMTNETDSAGRRRREEGQPVHERILSLISSLAPPGLGGWDKTT